MRYGSPAWQGVVFGGGLALAGAAGVGLAGAWDNGSGTVWAFWIFWTFLAAYGANRLQRWLARPPLVAWRSAFVGAVVFLPMFLGWFPATGWLQGVASAHGFRGEPSPLWLAVAMAWGLLAPGGLYADLLLRRLAPRP